MAGENAQGNLAGVNLAVGAVVVLLVDAPGQYRVNTNDRFDLEAGEQFEVTRVYSETLQVRTIGTKRVRVSYHSEQRRVSFTLSRSWLRFQDPNYVPPPAPRKLGVTPTHEEAKLSEDVEVIGINHPGIQWLWDDMGKYATDQGYCPQYDALAIRLGIPGRPRDFSVTTTVNGLTLHTTVQARSQREANELVEAAMKGPSPETPDTASTPVESEVPVPA